ncbi:hypothetical protein HYH03_002186 [Edaphochlamys debaryana]|uniref:F-box domain-containing protein n=1 Tax=Edaphochlamys debaryana TaxID=47281 RepID=A0A835YET1_9CHLO|nr:hypothetical protein HYH03_002186 [Edaphochlamys debaryana]|eukprot:KAG2499898.1 hypothetical protein HYH03_002186 [Edaphochlamys debaryana]
MAGAILLLGPHTGAKARLGCYLQQLNPSCNRFAALDCFAADVERWRELDDVCRATTGGDTADVRPSSLFLPCAVPLLVLDCVKDVRDGFALLAALRRWGIQLLQVLYVPLDCGGLRGAAFPDPDRGPNATTTPRTDPKLKEQLWGTWVRSASRLLELFSSLGLLTELGLSEQRTVYDTGCNAQSLAALGYGDGPSWIGNDRGFAQDTQPAKRGRYGAPAAPEPPSPPPSWLAAAGGRLPSTLKATPLRPVTCPAADPSSGDGCGLVVCGEERRRVLAEAELLTGLRGLDEDGPDHGGDSRGCDGSATHFLEPAARVRSAAEVRWVSWPGRYAMRRRRADAVRFLLLALGPASPAGSSGGGRDGANQGAGTSGAGESAGGGGGAAGLLGAGGRVYLLNPAGALYACRTAAELGGGSPGVGGSGDEGALPPGTVLDGELVWRDRRAFYIATDALCVGGRRVWHLGLASRLAAMGPGAGELQTEPRDPGGSGGGQCLGLASEDDSSELRRAEAAPKEVLGPKAGLSQLDSLPCCPPPLPPPSPYAPSSSSFGPAPASPVLTVLRASYSDVIPDRVPAQPLVGARGHSIVFVPNAVPYALLTPELLYEWAPGSRALDRFVASGLEVVFDLKRRMFVLHVNSKRLQLLPELMYECHPNAPVRLPGPRPPTYEPVAVRWDLPYGAPSRPSTWVARAVAGDNGTYDKPTEWLRKQGRFADATALAAGVRLAQLVAGSVAGGRPVAPPLLRLRLRLPAGSSGPSPAGAAAAAGDAEGAGAVEGPIVGTAEAQGSVGGAAPGAAPASASGQSADEAWLGLRWQARSEVAGMAYADVVRVLAEAEAAGAVAQTEWRGGLVCYSRSAAAPDQALPAVPGLVVLHPPSEAVVAAAWLGPWEGAEERHRSPACAAVAAEVRWREEPLKFGRSLPYIRATLLPDDEGTVDYDTDSGWTSDESEELGERNEYEMDLDEHEEHVRKEDRKHARWERKDRNARQYDSLSEDERAEMMGVVTNPPPRTKADARKASSKSSKHGASEAPKAVPCGVASALVDGWPVLGFVWEGDLVTAAEGDMKAPEALWSADWVRVHANVAAFRPGWTYELRAVYDAGPRVVPYAFEGVVLAAAVAPDGSVQPPSALAGLAGELGLTCAVPYFVGPMDELKSRGRLPGLLSRRHWWRRHRPPGLRGPHSESRRPRSAWPAGDPDEPPRPPALQPSLRFKGWRLQPLPPPASTDGTSSSQAAPKAKLEAALSYDRASYAVRMLHPLAVWDRVCFAGADPGSLAYGLPRHLASELGRQLTALEAAWAGVRQEALQLLEAARSQAKLERLARFNPALSKRAWAAAEAEADQAGDAVGGVAAGPSQDAAALATRLLLELRGPAGAAAAAAPLPEATASLYGKPSFAAAVCTAAAKLRTLGAAALLPHLPYGPARGLPPWPRELLLRCVRPARDGSGLPCYVPSPALARLWANGWAGGPTVGRTAQPPPATGVHLLLDELLERCLAPLEGRDLVAALCVCRRWRRVLRDGRGGGDGGGAGAGGSGLAQRLLAGRVAAERREENEREARRQRRMEGMPYDEYDDDAEYGGYDAGDDYGMMWF